MSSKLIGNIKDFTSKWHYLKQEVDDKFTEVNTKLSGKSDVGHTHSDDDVTVTTTNYGSGLNQNSFNSYLSYDMIQVKNKVNSVVHTSIALDKYNCSVGDTVTVTVTCTDSAGAVVANRDVSLYVNGSSVNSGKTNTSGVASFTYTVSTEYINVFKVDDALVQCYANPVSVLLEKTTNYKLYRRGNMAYLLVNIPSQKYTAKTSTTVFTLDSKYCNNIQSYTTRLPFLSEDMFAVLNPNGTFVVYNNMSSDKTHNVICTLVWVL